ncbi:MAG: glycosyltransferase family 2 protein [Candidatus Bathyarchaeia archaeon]
MGRPRDPSMKSVSFVIVTYNSEEILGDCLQSIANQDYPKDRIEIIVVDGGSTDSTLDIARSFGARIIHERTGRPESATAIGFSHAKNELIANVASDNILPHRNWLRMLVQPFDIDESIIATQPLRYTYIRTDTLLNRYFSLFGVNDPVPYYLNRRDRLSWIENTWNLLGEARDHDGFFVVRFAPEEVPTLGANGFVVRRKIIQKALCEPENFFHIDVNYDIIKLGYDTYGIVKTDIIHRTGERFLNFFRKRVRYVRLFWRDQPRRRYVYLHTPADLLKLLKFVISAATLLKPTSDAINGYRKIPDVAWFLHPIVSLGLLLIYGIVFMERKMELLLKPQMG